MRYDRSSLVEYLSPYSDREKINKQFYEVKKDPAKLSAFRESLPLEQRKLVEYMIWQEGIVVCELDERYSFFVDISQNIRLEKHERYSIELIHYHTFFELIYVLKGSCKNTIQNKAIWMQEDDFCLISPGVVHSMGVYDDSIVINVLIRKPLFKETFSRILSNNTALAEYFNEIFYSKNINHYLVFHTKGDDLLHSIMESLIWEEYQNVYDKHSDEIKEGLLEAIFSYLIRNHSRKMEASKTRYSDRPKITEILKYLQENYQTATLKSTAFQFHYTQQYLSSLLHLETGLRYKEILTNIRMQNACDLLKNSELKILEISAAVGYENPEHFHRLFRQKTNLTPREYRKQHGKIY